MGRGPFRTRIVNKGGTMVEEIEKEVSIEEAEKVELDMLETENATCFQIEDRAEFWNLLYAEE